MMLPYRNNVLSIPSDNSTEFAKHNVISQKLEADFYFANSYASWERGLSEYTNKLIRQYIPKGTDISKIPHQEIKEIQYKINRRPRENINFKTPREMFYNFVS